MINQYFTAGEFAKLARTTKRTVQWYDREGILKPIKIDPENGYRYFEPKQIIDFQAILMLRKLNFSLREIRDYLTQNNTLEKLFERKKRLLEDEVQKMQNQLKETEQYYKNLSSYGTLVKPIIKVIKPFEIYYLLKIGPYAKIGQYCDELRDKFVNFPKNGVMLTMFIDQGYRPRQSKMKIGVIKGRGLKLNKEAENEVKSEKVPGFRALTHQNYGSSKLLSLLWRELNSYRREHKLTENKALPFEDMEIYYRISDKYTDEEGNYMAEICAPVM